MRRSQKMIAPCPFSSFLLLSAVLPAMTMASMLPRWTAPMPDLSQPLAGYSQYYNIRHAEVYHGTPDQGTYNHAAMLDHHRGILTVMWKNAPRDEDEPGQRILVAQSTDGVEWTPTDGKNILFPNMSTTSFPAAQFVGPTLTLEGRVFAAASPWITAQGAQFCLWPDPVDARDCGPPGQKQPKGILMLRELLPTVGKFGPVFWAAKTVPRGFEEASTRNGILTVSQMPSDVQALVGTLSPDMPNPPCATKGDGMLKCEACAGGCQDYSALSKKVELANERAHWVLPQNSSTHATADTIVYRSHSHGLYASVRTGKGKWSTPTLTNIPNDDTNINAGPLPNGRVYLVSNPLYHPKDANSPDQRDPCTIATSDDGISFNQVGVVMSCTNLSATSTCEPRNIGKSKNTGPSYPQGMSVVDPAPAALQGFYVVASNNKEDIWIAKVPYDSLGLY